MDSPSGLITIRDDVDITGLTPDQCTTVEELTEPNNPYAIGPLENFDSVHSDDAPGSPTTTVSDGAFGEDNETDPFNNNIVNTQPLRAPNYNPLLADGSHYSGLPYFVPQGRNIFDSGTKIRECLTTPSPLPGNMDYNTMGINQDGNTSGVQVQPQSNIHMSDYQLPTPQASGYLRPVHLQAGSMNQAPVSTPVQKMAQLMHDRLLQQFQPTGNQFRNYPLQPPMLPSENAGKWRNRVNCNGFPWAPSVVPNAQMGYQSYPAVGQNHYSLPRERTSSMMAQLPTPPNAPFDDFLAPGNPSPALPMPQATFYNPKNKYMETENMFAYKDTLLTRREICLLVALERYLHLDHDTCTEILRYHRHDYETHIDLKGFIDWALAYPSDTHEPTSQTERDYQAARRQEATKPVTQMVIDCLGTSAGFWARQAGKAHLMWRQGMTQLLRRMRAEGEVDRFGNLVQEQSLHGTFQQQQPQQQNVPSQDRGRTMLQTPDQTRHPSVQQTPTPRNQTLVHKSPTAAKTVKRSGAVQKRQKSQTPSSARHTITTNTAASITKEKKKRAPRKSHSRSASKDTLGHSRNTSNATPSHSRTTSMSDSRAGGISASHNRTLSNQIVNPYLHEGEGGGGGSIDPALLGHKLESVIQEEENEEDYGQEPGAAAMMGTPVLATDTFQPAQQHTGGGAEEVNFEEWMEHEAEEEEGKGGSDSEYVPE